MKYTRLAILALTTASLISCQTGNAIMNSFPVRFMDGLASSALGVFAANELPASGRPASIEERARQVENRDMYAGKMTSVAADASRQSMAAR